MEPFLVALIVHGVIGGADVLLNHELIGKLPSRPDSAAEQRLHSARELVFGTLFLTLAWFEWHGLAALAIVALLLAELAISTADTVLEWDRRVLPVSERIAHVVLFVNFGVLLALLGQALLAWLALPTAVLATDHGAASWGLSGLALGAFAWSVRDALSSKRGKAAAAA